MKPEHKLYAVLAAIVILGLAVYFVRKGKDEVEQAHSHTAPTDLPTFPVTEPDIEKITKLEIKNKDEDSIVLEKKDDEWVLAKPLPAKCNQKNVEDTIKNLDKIEINDLITTGADQYAKHDLDADKAVHIVAYKGAEPLVDFYVGKSGGRGQMIRLAGTDGVYVAKGYQGHMFTRELKQWRKTEIWKFEKEDKTAVGVELENKHGKFVFAKKDDKWEASFTKRGEDGALAAQPETWEDFDEKKLQNMLRNYKNLQAQDFAGKEATPAVTGLDAPAQHGGIITIKLEEEDGARQLKLLVGKAKADDDDEDLAGDDDDDDDEDADKNKSRYAQKDGDATVYILSSFSAKWAVADQSGFEKTDLEKKNDKKDGDKKGDDEAKPKPPPMPMPPPPPTP